MTEGDVRLVTLSHLRTHYLDSYTKFIPLPEMHWISGFFFSVASPLFKPWWNMDSTG